MLQEIRSIRIDSSSRLEAIGKATARREEQRIYEHAASLFHQIRQVEPNSEERLKALQKHEQARQFRLDADRRVADES